MRVSSKNKIAPLLVGIAIMVMSVLALLFFNGVGIVHAETIMTNEPINESVIDYAVDTRYYSTHFNDIEALDSEGFVLGGWMDMPNGTNASQKAILQIINDNYEQAYEITTDWDNNGTRGYGITINDLMVDSNRVYFAGNRSLYGDHIVGKNEGTLIYDEIPACDYNSSSQINYITQTSDYSFVYARGSEVLVTPNYAVPLFKKSDIVSIDSLKDDCFFIATDKSIMKYSVNSPDFIWEKTFTNTTINKVLVENGFVYVIGNTTNINDSNFAFTHGNQDGIIIKLDNDGNVVDSATFGGDDSDTFYQSNIKNGRIVIRFNENKILIVNANNLAVFEQLQFSLELLHDIKAIAIDVTGVVAMAGNVSSNSGARTVIIETLTSMGFQDKSIEYGEVFDPADGIAAPLSEVVVDNIEGYNDDTFNTTVGYHDLTYNFRVINDNGTKNYTLTRRITVEPISSIKPNDIYDGEIKLNVRGGTTTLNGEPFAFGDSYELPGNHEIRITGINGYEKIIPFRINLSAENVKENETYLDSVTPTFRYGTWTLNGNAFESGTEINTPGNYILSGTAINGLTRTYEFTVDPTGVYVTNGVTYSEPLIVSDANGTLKLNGEDYVAGTELNASGSYVFEIFGAGGYYKKWEFWIAAGSNLNDGEFYENSKEINFVGAATLDGNAISTGCVVTEVGNHEFVLTDGTYSETIHFTVIPDYSIYNEPIYLTHTLMGFDGVSSLTVNGETQSNGYKINEVGNYTLSIMGVGGYSKTIEFVVLPQINVADGADYLSPFVLTANGGNITLNGDALTKEEQTLNQVGNYCLNITGVNGYSCVVNFAIKEVVSGFIDGNIYTAPSYPTVNIPNATLTLDGTPITSGEIVVSVGNHTLIVGGINGYSSAYTFTVKEANPNISKSYVGSFTPNIPNATLFLNDEEYTNRTPIQTVGNHILRVTGVGGYETQYAFTITEKVSGIVDGGSYSLSATPIVPYATLLLDGEAFTSGTVVQTVGKHTLKAQGVGGYENIYTFTITEVLYGLTGGTTYNSPVMFTFGDIPSVTVNGKSAVSGATYSIAGLYDVAVQGTNGYRNTYRFEIGLKHNLKDNGVYVGSVHPSANARQMLLNGENYDGIKAITAFGNYKLQFLGEGGYTSTILFTVTPIVIGIEDGKTYSTAITPVIKNAQSLTLNDATFESGITINSAGNYVLQMNGVGGYTQTIQFTVNHILTVDGTLENGAYNESVKFNCENALLKINGNEYVSGTAFTTFGTHTLSIIGIGGYLYTQSFKITPIIRGVQDGGVYDSSVTPNIADIQSLMLNDVPYINNTPISAAGNHSLTIIGTRGDAITIKFTIAATVNGIAAGGSYSNAVSFTSNADVYINGEMVSERFNRIGHHTVVLKGIGGYESAPITFTINPADINIANGETYSVSCNYAVSNAQGVKLNGQVVPVSGTVNSIGINTLEVLGVGGYVLPYTFTVTPNIEHFESDYIGNASFSLGGVSLKIDGKDYVSGETYSSVGNHTLMIMGVGGYEQAVKFTVKERSNIENGAVFQNDATINIDNSTSLMLNGVAITNGEKITKIGNHTLKITGSNGYENIYTFTIKPILTISDGEEFSRPFALQKVDGIMTLNGKAIHSDITIDRSGKYTLIIAGEGGYTETITFNYTNPNESLALFIGIPVLIAAVAVTLFIFIKRRRVV